MIVCDLFQYRSSLCSPITLRYIKKFFLLSSTEHTQIQKDLYKSKLSRNMLEVPHF